MHTIITAELFQRLSAEDRQREINRYAQLPPRLQRMDERERLDAAIAALTDEEKANALAQGKRPVKAKGGRR